MAHLGLQQCSLCMRRAVAPPCSTRSREHERSWHCDSVGSLIMSLFREAGGWAKLSSS